MSEKMADAMMLEDVRDWHRGCEQAANADGHIRAAAAHKQLADAIDAAIAPQRGLLCGTTPDGRPYALRGTPESVHAVSDLIEQATDQDAHCPYIVTSDEGTSHCRLAEQDARDAWQPIETAPAAIERAERAEAELAALRARIEGAATGTVVEIGTDDEGQPRVLIHSTESDLRKGPAILFKTVALVPVAGEGGE